jgi:hypothetical protein
VSLSNGESLTVPASCINLSPLEVNGVPTLIHQVVTLGQGCLTVINHWSVDVNLIIMGIMIGLSLLLVNKGLVGIYGDPYD